MPSEAILITLAPYAAVALALVITIGLFFSVKYEFMRTTRRERKRIDEILERLNAASSPPLAQLPKDPEPVFVPIAGPAGLNLNRRVHALRLLRKGQNVAHISAALGVPRQEIELLVRVQDLIANSQAAKATQA